MLVAELVAGILCEGDEGACDFEDLVVVIGMIGQQLRPADDRFCITGAPPARSNAHGCRRALTSRRGRRCAFCRGRSRREVLRGAGHGP